LNPSVISLPEHSMAINPTSPLKKEEETDKQKENSANSVLSLLLS